MEEWGRYARFDRKPRLRGEIEKELDAQYSAEASKENYDYEEGEKANRLRRQQRLYEHLSWRKFAGGNLSTGAAQPAELQAIPVRDGLAVEPSDLAWRTRSGGVEVRASHEGLYKVSQGQLTKVRSGFYHEPVIVPGGRWTLATKLDAGAQLMRVNLLTGREFRVEISGSQFVRAAAYIPSVKRVLVGAGYYGDMYESSRITWFLLDPKPAPQQERVNFPHCPADIGRCSPPRNPDEFWPLSRTLRRMKRR